MSIFHGQRMAPARVTDCSPSYRRAAGEVPALSLLTLVGAVGLTLAGCSAAPRLDSLTTGSVAPAAPAAFAETVPAGVAPDDWETARHALAEALGESQAAPSVPWENYASSTRGTVTPLTRTAAASGGDAAGCRGFLMSFVRGSSEEWLEGEACQSANGGWKVDQARMLDKG